MKNSHGFVATNATTTSGQHYSRGLVKFSLRSVHQQNYSLSFLDPAGLSNLL